MENLSDQEERQLVALDQQIRIASARAAAKRKDILTWGRRLFPHKFNLPFCPFHHYLVEIRSEDRTATEGPRNHAKTTCECFLVEIFQALEEPETFRHYLNVQATGTKAIAINVAIKSEIETNVELRAIYGNQVGLKKWTDQQFVLANGVIFTAIGATQSLRGINYRNIRPDYIVVDDLYDEEDINNPGRTEKKNDWFWSSLYPARAKNRRNSIHLQGTAINAYDLLEKLKSSARWKSRTFQGIEGWDGSIPMAQGSVLWPELNTFEDLMDDMDDMGTIIFMREIQNERRDEKTAIIKRSYLAKWEYDPTDLDRELKRADKIVLLGWVIGNDPSIGKKSNDKSDETGITLIRKTRWVDSADGVEYWIENIRGEKMGLLERIAALEEYAKSIPHGETLMAVYIEAISGFDDYASEATRKTSLPIVRVTRVPDKITNLENSSHFFQNGKVHINKNVDTKEKEKLIYQLTTNHPKHDDLRDALLLALEKPDNDWSWVK